MLKLKDNMGTVSQTIIFTGGIKISAKDLAEVLRQCAEESGVEVEISDDTIHDGGLFTGKDYSCVVLKHPNPPQEYFYQVWVINGKLLNFYYFGRSKANYKVNTYNQKSKGGFFDRITASISGSAEMELQVEQEWHREVFSLLSAAERKTNPEQDWSDFR